jgi:hypothetical protein
MKPLPTSTMQLWQVAVISVVCLGLAVDCALFAASSRAMEAWPTADAQIVSHQQRNLPRGTATFLRGHFAVGSTTYEFERPWGSNTWDGERWIAPTDTPSDNTMVRVRYNPAQPSEVALGPTPTPSNGVFFFAAAALLTTLAAVAIVAWRTQSAALPHHVVTPR